MKRSHIPNFFEIFPYKLSTSGAVSYNKKLFTFQTASVILACTFAATMTFVDSYVILKTKNVTLYFIYVIRRLAFVCTIVVSYFSIVVKQLTPRRLLTILRRTVHFDASIRTLHSKWWFQLDCAFLLVMVSAIIVQDKGNHSGLKGRMKILSNFLMNLLLYFMLSYYRRILYNIADKLNSIDLSSNPTEVSRRHAVLYEAAKATVKMFSVAIIGVMGISGIYLTSNLMYILGNRRKYLAQFIVSSCYLIYYTYIVCEVVVGSCCTVLKAANRVTDYMIESCLESKNSKTVKIFRGHYNLYGNLELRPLGLVVLDKQFLTQYFGAVVSYVAITLDYMDLIQN